MTEKIILDTNFLVAPFQLSIDLFEEIERIYPFAEVYTIEEALEEAKSIESGKYGNLVEKLIETQDIEVLETEGKGIVDDLLVNVSDEYLVATNDKELKQRIVDKGRPVMLIRSKNHLEVVNGRETSL